MQRSAGKRGNHRESRDDTWMKAGGGGDTDRRKRCARARGVNKGPAQDRPGYQHTEGSAGVRGHVRVRVRVLVVAPPTPG